MKNPQLRPAVWPRIALLVLLCPVGLRAQVTTASILGTVTDRSGAVVPGAQVTATSVETNFSRAVNADAAGQYAIRFLPIGTYRVEATVSGFKKFEQSGIVLEVGRNARIDPVLDLGTLTETVSVTADAPMVNTVDATIGRTVSNTEILNLPLVGRNVYSLLDLTPGVGSLNTGDNVFGFPETRTMINGSVNGGAGSVNFFLDGGNNATGLRNTGNEVPNPDAVQEFRVITNSYGAEFGRFGGGVIDVVTKSGTNLPHGSLFEFMRNEKLNAHDWKVTDKTPLRRNQFGGTLGGPLRKDRLFFFTSYSGLRQRYPVTSRSGVPPTPLERSGNFSASARKPNDPLTGRPFPNAIIPIDRFDPVARRILDEYIPKESNYEGGRYLIQETRPLETDHFLFKLDAATSTNHQVAGSYFRNQGEDIEKLVGGANFRWSERQFSWKQQNVNLSDTWTVNPNTVNQVRLTYVRHFGGRLNLPAKSLGDLGSTYKIQGAPSLPRIQVRQGYFTLGQSIAGPAAGSNYYGLREVLALTRGRHSLKLGGDFSLEKYIHDTTLDNYGTFDFTGAKTGNALADFYLGFPNTWKQDAPVTKIDNGWYWGLFIQDDFRIRPNLTLNVGLRYEFQSPMLDPHDRKLTFVAGRQSRVVPGAPAGLLFPGDPGVGRGVISADKNNFAPRLGLAWDPSGNGRTSVRAGAGLFYGSISGNEWNASADNQPFAIRQTFYNTEIKTLSDPYKTVPGGVSPFPYDYTPSNPRFLLPASVMGPSLDFRWPYFYQFNLSVQRQVLSDVSVTAAYVSALGHKLPFQRDINYPIYGRGATAANVNQRRPFLPGTLAGISLLDSMMNTAYHSLQLSAEKRMSRRFSLQGSYVWGKALEGARLTNDTTGGGAQNMNNLRAERARTEYDKRHVVLLSGIWEVAYFGGANPALRHLLNHWRLTGIYSWQSGDPFTVSSGVDSNLDGSSDRAHSLGRSGRLDPNRPRNEVLQLWFDPTAFATPATGEDGNAGRFVLDTPGYTRLDLGIFRDFRLREALTLQFRCEMTNAFNVVNLSGPASDLNNVRVGQISGAGAMRRAQLGLRLIF
ncbi:MAG: TonB-dependent receptor [Acidobacteriota bacterium]